MKTNSEILKTSEAFLGPYEKQTKFVLEKQMVQLPCPVCAHRQNLPEAAGVALDDFNAGNSQTHTYTCQQCACPLRRVVPMVIMGPGWFWTRDHDREWARDPLKAKP